MSPEKTNFTKIKTKKLPKKKQKEVIEKSKQKRGEKIYLSGESCRESDGNLRKNDYLEYEKIYEEKQNFSNENYKRNKLKEKKINKLGFLPFNYTIFTLYILFSIKIKSSSTSSVIILIINQTGLHRIYFEGEPKVSGVSGGNVNNPPSNIYINNENKEIHYFQNLNEENNTIKLEWNTLTDMSYIFHQCANITKIDLSSTDTSSVTAMSHIFNGCTSLTSVNFGNINTPLLTKTVGMFANCHSLESVDLSRFSGAPLITIRLMFGHCTSLTSIDLSPLQTNRVTNFGYLFTGCKFLKSITFFLSTSLADTMDYMFSDCHSLTSLDLSHFDTNNVEKMNNMFKGCSSLKYLNISSFIFKITSNLNMSNMFSGCSSLVELDIKNFATSTNAIIDNIFKGISKNIILCNKNNAFNKLITSYEYKIVKCSEEWGVYKNNISVNENNKCINDCLLSKIEDYSKCYQICSYYFYFNKSTYKYECTEDYICPSKYPKLILEKNECVFSCQENKLYIYEYNNICLLECPEYFETKDETPFYCFPKCPKNFPFLSIKEMECVDYCSISQRQNKLCITNYFDPDYNNDIIDTVIDQTRSELLNDFNSSVINGNMINEYGVNITLTRTNEQKDYIINFGECENKLKIAYGINLDESLYLMRIDKEEIGMKTPLFIYELYYPINETNKNLVKLDLSKCNGCKIDITIPLKEKIDNLDKYNKSSGYYNDICYTTDSENNTDIILSDRNKEYVDNNMSICEINCEFKFYNSEENKAVCSCEIKTQIPSMKDIKLDKELLLQSFIDINNFMNIKILFCYKTIFKLKNLLKNYGFLIFSALIIISIICLFLFYCKNYKKLIFKFKKLSSAIKDNKKLSINKKNNINKTLGKNKIKKYKNNNKFNSKNNIPQQSKKIKKIKFQGLNNLKLNNNKSNSNEYINNQKQENIIKKNNNIIKEIRLGNMDINRNRRNKINNKFNHINNNLILSKNKTVQKKTNNNIKKSKINTNKFSKKKIVKIKLTNSELNDLEFEKALAKDKRTFCQFYISLIKENHILISIFQSGGYDSSIIKLTLFIFNFSSLIAVNALFFNDSTMHKIYIDQGSFDIIYQLPQIIYSTLISAVLDFIINSLGLSESKILTIKDAKILEFTKIQKGIIKTLKIKFAFFYLIDFFLLIIFWYYVSCFCGIYKNTQIHLINDSLISFGTSLLSLFWIALISGIFRILGLRKKNKCCYGFSKFLQIFS